MFWGAFSADNVYFILLKKKKINKNKPAVIIPSKVTIMFEHQFAALWLCYLHKSSFWPITPPISPLLSKFASPHGTVLKIQEQSCWKSLADQILQESIMSSL